LKEYTVDKIKNVALGGHSGCGKTTLSEAILFSLKITERQGRIDDGNTISDYDPEEIKRKISINASLLPVEYKGFKINFLDTPGSRDFIGETKGCVRASDASVVVVDATSGSEVGTEFAVEYAQGYKHPVAFFITKLEKERANFERVIESLKMFEKPVVPVAIPIGQESGFVGIMDLLTMNAIFDTETGKYEIREIPAEYQEEAKNARAKMIEAAAEADEELLNKFCADEPLTPEEILRGLRTRFVAGELYPVLCGSGLLCSGVQNLLEFIIQCFPAPDEYEFEGYENEKQEKLLSRKVPSKGPLIAFVFKTISDPYAGRLTFFKVYSGEFKSDSTVHNMAKRKDERIQHVLVLRGKKQETIHKIVAGDIGALAKLSVTVTGDTLVAPNTSFIIPPTVLPHRTYTMALVGKSKAEEEKIGLGVHKIVEQDPTLEIRRDPEIRQTLISGMGETHLDVAVSRLKTLANVDIQLAEPRVPYHETITKKAEGSYRHKKQSGGRGQFAEVWLKVEPLSEGSGFEFEWHVVGGVIPTKFQPSVEKGINEALEKGIIAGYRTVDVKAICFDGKDHPVDSSDMAFKIAASVAFKQTAKTANPIMLEPIYKLDVTVPNSFMGDVMGDLSSRRGRPLGQEQHGDKITITALVPLAEMFTYSKDLRSITQGRGFYEITYDHYEQVPSNLQEKIIEKAQKGHLEEKEE